jgi:hypothetical protein
MNSKAIGYSMIILIRRARPVVPRPVDFGYSTWSNGHDKHRNDLGAIRPGALGLGPLAATFAFGGRASAGECPAEKVSVNATRPVTILCHDVTDTRFN